MFEDLWSEDIFADFAARLTKVERKLTDSQLQSIRQYYRMNNSPTSEEVEEIVKEWNVRAYFYIALNDWFFCRRMGDREVAMRRAKARKTAA